MERKKQEWKSERNGHKQWACAVWFQQVETNRCEMLIPKVTPTLMLLAAMKIWTSILARDMLGPKWTLAQKTHYP